MTVYQKDVFRSQSAQKVPLSLSTCKPLHAYHGSLLKELSRPDLPLQFCVGCTGCDCNTLWCLYGTIYMNIFYSLWIKRSFSEPGDQFYTDSWFFKDGHFIMMISQFLAIPAEWVLWFRRKCLNYWMDCQRNIVKCSCPQNFISPCAAVVCDQIPDKLM